MSCGKHNGIIEPQIPQISQIVSAGIRSRARIWRDRGNGRAIRLGRHAGAGPRLQQEWRWRGASPSRMWAAFSTKLRNLRNSRFRTRLAMTGSPSRAALAAALLALLLGGAALAPPARAQEEFRFDAAEMEKPPFTLGGYLQALGSSQRLATDAAQYRLLYFDAPRRQVDASELRLHLDAGYRAGWLGLVLRGDAMRTDSYAGPAVDSTLQEAYLTAQPAPVFTLDLGKRV